MYDYYGSTDRVTTYLNSLEDRLGVDLSIASSNTRHIEAYSGEGKLLIAAGHPDIASYQNWVLDRFPTDGPGHILFSVRQLWHTLYDCKVANLGDDETPIVVTDANGNERVLAVVKPGIVFVMFDLPALMTATREGYFDEEAWDHFFMHVAGMALDSEAMAEWRAGQAERNRQAMLDYVRRSSAQSVDELVSEIGTMTATLADYVQGIASTRHKLRDRQALLSALMDNRDGNEQEAADKAWTLLAADERVQSLEFRAGKIVLHTEPLNITHPETGLTVYLGKFRIEVNLSTTHIAMFNIDNAKGGFDHPHVHMHRPCFGEMGDGIHALIMQGELYAAVEMIFVFLSSVNLNDDWGRRSVFWFEAEQPAVQEVLALQEQADLTGDDEDYDAVDDALADLVEA